MNYSKYQNYVALDKMTKIDNKPEWLVVHCSASDYDDFKSIQQYHITDPAHFWENIGYHYVIERGGKLVSGRPEKYHGAHVAESDKDGVRMNVKSIGICICGDFENKKPDAEQIKTLTRLLQNLCVKYNIPKEKIKPHRFWAGAYKTCFGSALPDNFAANLAFPDTTSTPPVAPVSPPAPASCDEAIKSDRKSILTAIINFIQSFLK